MGGYARHEDPINDILLESRRKWCGHGRLWSSGERLLGMDNNVSSGCGECGGGVEAGLVGVRMVALCSLDVAKMWCNLEPELRIYS